MTWRNANIYWRQRICNRWLVYRNSFMLVSRIRWYVVHMMVWYPPWHFVIWSLCHKYALVLCSCSIIFVHSIHMILYIHMIFTRWWCNPAVSYFSYFQYLVEKDKMYEYMYHFVNSDKNSLFLVGTVTSGLKFLFQNFFICIYHLCPRYWCILLTQKCKILNTVRSEVPG